MKARLIPLLAVVGWTMLIGIAAWVFVVMFTGWPSLGALVWPFGLVAVALVLIGAGQEVEQR